MAAKWEFEDNKNVPNCRALFQRGLRVNSASKQLWLEVHFVQFSLKVGMTLNAPVPCNRPFAKMAAFKLFFCSYSKEPH